MKDETHAQLRAIAEHEQRTLTAVLERALHLYAQQRPAADDTAPGKESTENATQR
jgi:predicted transcriptional regulator